MQVVDTIVMRDISTIRPYFRNPRDNDRTVEELVKLIPKVGFNVPLVLDTDGVIIKGHSRWKAAIKLGMDKVPTVTSTADAESIRLDRILDNKLQELSEWNDELLQSELAMMSAEFDADLKRLELTVGDAIDRLIENAGAVELDDDPDAEADRQFINQKDIDATHPSAEVNNFTEVTCSKCGNHMFIRK